MGQHAPRLNFHGWKGKLAVEQEHSIRRQCDSLAINLTGAVERQLTGLADLYIDSRQGHARVDDYAGGLLNDHIVVPVAAHRQRRGLPRESRPVKHQMPENIIRALCENGSRSALDLAGAAGSREDTPESIILEMDCDASATATAAIAVGFSIPITSVRRDQAGPTESAYFEIDASS